MMTTDARPRAHADEDDPFALSDATLALAVGCGYEHALAEIYRRHAGAVSSLAKRILGASGLTDDVVQDVFVQLWNRPERFEPARGSLRTFLLVHCHGRCVDLVRAEDARHKRETREANATPSSSTPCEDAVLEHDHARELQMALAELPDRERMPIELAFFGGYTYREVAALLRLPEGTIKTRIRTGLTRLRTRLQQVDLA